MPSLATCVRALIAGTIVGLAAACIPRTPPTPSPTVATEPSAQITATVAPTPTLSTPVAWERFDGDGYTLAYPSTWYAYPFPASTAPSGIRYNLILSDAPGNQDPQSATPDERARVTLWHVPRADQPLAVWVAQRWAWLNTELASTTSGGAPALRAERTVTSPPLYQGFRWIEYNGNFYVVEAYGRTDVPGLVGTVQDVLGSLKFQGGEATP